MTGVQRLVSLLPSTTETVFALGAGHCLVGRSHECDLPEEVRTLPVLTQPALDPGKPSAEIDRDVKSLVERALSLYRVDAVRLRELRPEVILTQTQCEVCAVTPRDLEDALRDLVGEAPEIVSTSAERLDDIFSDVVRIADAIGLPHAGRELADRERTRIGEYAGRARPLEKPRVACIEWIEPLMAAGNWMPELVELAGGIPVFGRAGEHSHWITFEDLRSADPDVVLLVPCGFDVSRTRAEAPVLIDRPGFAELSAMRTGRVYILDGNRHFNRPGPRIAESLEILLEVLHPDRFGFGHRDTAWSPLLRIPDRTVT